MAAFPNAVAGIFDRARLILIADLLAVVLAVSLPWSTSVTEISAWLLLFAIIPTLDPAALRREFLSPASGLPVLLVLLGLAGMAWADVTVAERISGFKSFYKLLFIPFLLVHFARSTRAAWVLTGFVASCAALLMLSWALVLLPGLTWRGKMSAGVPVKDYISQATLFAVCILVLCERALTAWQDGRLRLALAHAALALGFLSNIVAVLASRTALVIIPVVLALLGWKRLAWGPLLGMAAAAIVLAGAVWFSTPSLRGNVLGLFQEMREFTPQGVSTRAGERLEYWRKSVRFIADAPLIGHGTGSMPDLFRRAAEGQTGIAGMATTNPHSQILGVAIQLGFVGVAALLAMWVAHLWLFRGEGFAAWVGLVIVVQNVIGSLFNSHLFDFTHGWLYVIGVSIAGGALRGAAARSPPQ